MPTKSRSGRGRPLSTAVEQSVFDETLRLVAANPEALTRRSIADGAGVSRQTLYNRWPSTADIVLDALLHRAGRTVGTTNPGDLRSYLTDLAQAIDGWARPALRSIAALAQADPTFARRFRDEFLQERHGALTAAVRTVVVDEARAHRIADLIAGSMWYRLLIVDAQLDQDWVDEMTALVTN